MSCLRTDRGGEFTSSDFNDYCTQTGVRRQLTTPYSLQQNGVVECRNQSVVAMACNMLKARGLPGYFWGEAVATAVYLLNRSPVRVVEGMTPFEAWYGKKPGLANLRTFGCVAHVKNTKLHLKKLDDRSTCMIFVGYETGSKAYRAYDPRTGRVHVTWDAVFDELAQWSWSEEDSAQVQNGSEPFEVEMVTTMTICRSQEGVKENIVHLAGRSSCRWIPVHRHLVQNPVHRHLVQNQLASPPSVEPNLDYDHDDAPLRFRKIDNVLGPAVVLGLAARVV
jgi:hypothetical protein